MSNVRRVYVEKKKDFAVKAKELQELNIANFDTSKVTRMAQMFAKCETLKNLDISNYNTSITRIVLVPPINNDFSLLLIDDIV